MKTKNSWALIILIVVVAVIAVVACYKTDFLQPKQAPSTSSVASLSTATENVSNTAPLKFVSDRYVEFPTNLHFSFPDYPGVDFKITKINRTYDPSADYVHFASGVNNPALLTVTLGITNNSNTKIDANYLQVMYTVVTGSDKQSRVAPYYIHTSYGVGPLTSTVITPTFIIPVDQPEISVAVGVYPPIIYNTAEELLSKSVDAFQINFDQKKAWHPEG